MAEEAIDIPILSPAIFNLRPVVSGVSKTKIEEQNCVEEPTITKPLSNTVVNEDVQLDEVVSLDVIQLQDDEHTGCETNAVLLHCDNPKYEKFVHDLYKFFNLQKTFRWMCAEFFYSFIDKPFYFNNNFQQYLESLCPSLKTRMLSRAEWGRLKSAIGRPRRFSSSFLEGERVELERHRRKTYLTKLEESDNAKTNEVQLLPSGTRVMARLKRPDNIYRGVIKSAYKRNFLVKFDEEDMGIQSVADFEIATEIVCNEMGNSGTISDNIEVSNVIDDTQDFVNGPCQLNSSQVLSKADRSDVEYGHSSNPYSINILKRLIELRNQMSIKAEIVDRLKLMNDQIEISNVSVKSFPESFQRNYISSILSLEKGNQHIIENFVEIEAYTKKLCAEEKEPTMASSLEKCSTTSSDNTKETFENDDPETFVKNITTRLQKFVHSVQTDETIADICIQLEEAANAILCRKKEVEAKPLSEVDVKLEPNQFTGN